MIVKYKTVLYGEYKPSWLEPKRLDDTVDSYKILDYEFCCDEIKEWIQQEIYYTVPFINENSLYVEIDYDSHYDIYIKYCPFCGEKVELKEVQRVKLKKVEKKVEKLETDYIEVNIK